MKKSLFVLISVMTLLISCEPIPGEKVSVEGSNLENVEVKKLFTVDGVSVYRFRDGCETVYFTNASGTIQYEEDEGDGNVTLHRTVCNGKKNFIESDSLTGKQK